MEAGCSKVGLSLNVIGSAMYSGTVAGDLRRVCLGYLCKEVS